MNTPSLLLLLALLQGTSTLCTAAPDDRSLLAEPEPSPATEYAGRPPVPATAIAPTPGSKLAEQFAKLSRANTAFTEELAAVVAAFPAYSPRKTAVQGTLRIGASDSLGAFLVRAAGSYKGINPDASVEVQQCGSKRGLELLKTGGCEMAAVSRELPPEECNAIRQATGKRVFIVQIATGAVCVYVNADNPLPGLTKAQCNGIFSLEHTMTKDPIIRWSQIDASSPLGNSAAPLYMDKKASGTLEVFKEWCMPGGNFTTINRFLEPGPSSVVNACCAYPAAIGIAGFAQKQPRARAVPLANNAGSAFVAPTIETIRKGSYPMRQRMNLVFVASSEDRIPPIASDFLRFLLSEDGQDMVVKNGLIPGEPLAIPSFLGSHSNDRWQ